MIIHAYYNHGRWIAECSSCSFALEIDRAFTQFRCGYLPVPWGVDPDLLDGNGRPVYKLSTGCGLEAGVQFPADADQIEAVLAQRPVRNRNWFAHETLADLRIENAVHQLPSGLEV